MKDRRTRAHEGELTEAAIHRFVQGFGGKPNSLTQELEDLRVNLQENPAGLEATALRERNQQQALAFLDEKPGVISWRIAKFEEREASEEEARQAAAVLPSMEVLRYG